MATRALIGHTGFVGSNLARQGAFDALYNSSNIESIAGSTPIPTPTPKSVVRILTARTVGDTISALLPAILTIEVSSAAGQPVAAP